MDIRIARTDRAIEQAFMELREKNPLEKIKIKDLCAMACINKSTFYAHYEDIYALANALETSSSSLSWPVYPAPTTAWHCIRQRR